MPIFPTSGDIAFGVNGKTIGNTTILTVPIGGPRFLPLKLIIFGSLLQLVGTPPTISLGTNSPNFNNIVPAIPLTMVGAGSNVFELIDIPAGAVVVAANDEALVFRVSVSATGTNYIMHVGVLGIELI